MSGIKAVLTPKQKALAVNLDPSIYGTFAEIERGRRRCVISLEQEELLVLLPKRCPPMIRNIVMLSMDKRLRIDLLLRID